MLSTTQRKHNWSIPTRRIGHIRHICVQEKECKKNTIFLIVEVDVVPASGCAITDIQAVIVCVYDKAAALSIVVALVCARRAGTRAAELEKPV